MGVSYTKIREDSTTLPSETASTFTWGENIPAGPIESIILRFTTANTTQAINGDFGSVINNVRLTLNGEVLHDYRAGYNSASATGASQYQYFLNGIGGRMLERPGDTAKEAYFVIPVGAQAPAGVSRLEAVISTAATNAAVASGTFQCWIRYNDATQTMTRVVPSTSFVHSTSIEQVVVRIPQNLPSGAVVSAILIQNNSAADQFGTQGIRIMSQSAYGLDPDFFRVFNGDLGNGIMYAIDGTSTTELQYAVEVAGGLLIPTYNLSTNGDVVLQVDSSEATTRTYTPVITAPFGARESAEARQTKAVPANTSQAILNRTLE